MRNRRHHFHQPRGISPPRSNEQHQVGRGQATGKDSLKTKEFAANPKAGLCFQEKGNSVVLNGEVEIIEDEATKQEMWQEWFSAHFSKGPTDPNYVLLKFKGHHATIWIDGHFVRRNL